MKGISTHQHQQHADVTEDERRVMKKSDCSDYKTCFDKIDWGWVIAIVCIVICIPLFSNKEIAYFAMRLGIIILICCAIYGIIRFIIKK